MTTFNIKRMKDHEKIYNTSIICIHLEFKELYVW